MARNFLTPINLSGLELQDAAIQGKTTSAISAITPASGGRIYYDNQLNVLKVYNGSTWQSIATGGSSFTLGSTSVSIGGTTTTVAGLTLSSPTFTTQFTLPGTTSGNTVITGAATAGTTAIAFPATSGTVITSGDTGTVTNAMLAGSIANGKLTNSSVTIGSTSVSLGSTASTISGLTSLSATTVTANLVGNVTGNASGSAASLSAASALPDGTTATTQAAGNNSTRVATTAYVDTAVFNGQAGFNVHASVAAASTANISGTYTAGTSDQSQGTGVGATFVFTAAQIDGVTLTSSMRVLLKNQTNKVHNGVYTVTTVSTNITLTRATDFDNSVAGEVFNGDLIYVGGTGTQAGTTWVMNSNGTATTPSGAIKIGTDDINWVQFAGAGTYTGTNGVSVSGTVISGANATTTTVGVASFPAAQFTVTDGSVSVSNLAGSVITSGTVADARIASALTSKTYNGITPTALATGFSLAGGSTTGKTLTVSETMTLTAGVASQTFTFPSTSATIAATDLAQTFSAIQTFSANVVATANVVTSRITAPTSGIPTLTLSTAAASVGGNQNINITGGSNSATGGSTQGANIVITGGALTGASTSGSIAGETYIVGGNATNGYGGGLVVNTGTGSNGYGSIRFNANGGTVPTVSPGGFGVVANTIALTGALTITGAKTTLAVHAAGYAALNIPSASTTITTPASGDLWNLSGVLQFNNGTATKQIAFTDGNITGSAASASQVTNSLVIKSDSGTTEGTDLYTFNGSAAKTINFVSGTGLTIAETSGTLTFNNSGVTSVNGSTGAITAVAKRVSGTTPAVTGTTHTITHSLGNKFVTCQIFDTTTGLQVEADVTCVDTNNLKIDFAASTTAGAYTYIIIG